MTQQRLIIPESVGPFAVVSDEFGHCLELLPRRDIKTAIVEFPNSVVFDLSAVRHHRHAKQSAIAGGECKMFSDLYVPIIVSASRMRNVPGGLLDNIRSASARRIMPQNQSCAWMESAGAT